MTLRTSSCWGIRNTQRDQCNSIHKDNSFEPLFVINSSWRWVTGNLKMRKMKICLIWLNWTHQSGNWINIWITYWTPSYYYLPVSKWSKSHYISHFYQIRVRDFRNNHYKNDKPNMKSTATKHLFSEQIWKSFQQTWTLLKTIHSTSMGIIALSYQKL